MEERREEGDRKSCKTVQIFVKMDGARTIVMDVAQNDKVSDVMKRIPSVATCPRRVVVRSSDELRSTGVYDGSTVQIMSRMRGGARDKDKKSKAEKKRDRDESGPDGQQQEEQVDSVSGNGQAILQLLEENEKYRTLME